VTATGIYWKLSVQNIIQIRSDLTYLLYEVYGINFFTGHSVFDEIILSISKKMPI